jgi:hypothetical protein
MASDTKVEAGTPKRIQRVRTKGWKMPPNTVYVGRPTRWGNPFTIKEVGDAQAAVDMFRGAIRTLHATLGFGELRRELRGKNLACWCKLSEPCHADVLLEIANAKEADHGR